ncbi:hypothetical protein [Mycetocola zhadangensis]|uniref:Uncharacterized protein n=1 Tax=Mycetocola zhadangensis TaxID=1164595 RepID=A0A3L7ISC7_9MICO|nr:hypothetical protein [Mycetocola zhadangensis]RLQ81126.1 hypothetical protein D9V28_15410 [Mycetocola zhadangensis]GGF05031.1 hypothetical protein GCM10011313_30150 [Mycetocola zhadangensis]
MAEDAAGRQFESPAPASVRAQLLATEHWGLLAARSTAQNEVLARIGIFLTLVSAGLVSLALVGQATDFSEAFVAFAVGVLAFIVLVGVLTQLRVMNIGMEDLMYVVAMNRLRGAYVELDPGLDRVLMSSPHDDFAGIQQTYYFFTPKRGISQVLGSTMAFIILINSSLLGLFIAATAVVFTSLVALAAVLGAAGAVLYFGLFYWGGNRTFRAALAAYHPEFPSPE